jgi:hypothetical protein
MDNLNTHTGACKPLRRIVTYSPTGFNFGYADAGPSDLALSILADFFGENPSREQLFYGQAGTFSCVHVLYCLHYS